MVSLNKSTFLLHVIIFTFVANQPEIDIVFRILPCISCMLSDTPVLAYQCKLAILNIKSFSFNGRTFANVPYPTQQEYSLMK